MLFLDLTGVENINQSILFTSGKKFDDFIEILKIQCPDFFNEVGVKFNSGNQVKMSFNDLKQILRFK